MSKFSTFVNKDKLYFVIEEGPFRGVEYKYESLTEAEGLKYKVTGHRSLISDKNKYLFEREIKDILKQKLGK